MVVFLDALWKDIMVINVFFRKIPSKPLVPDRIIRPSKINNISATKADPPHVG